MKSNQTTTSNLFTIFGTPSRVIVNGNELTEKHVVAAYLNNIIYDIATINSLAIYRIDGVVTVVIDKRLHTGAEAAKC